MSDLGVPLDYKCTSPLLQNTAWFIGETARPMSIYMVSASVAYKFAVAHVQDVGALTVMAGVVTLLYGAKVTEKALIKREEAKVDAKRAEVVASAVTQ